MGVVISQEYCWLIQESWFLNKKEIIYDEAHQPIIKYTTGVLLAFEVLDSNKNLIKYIKETLILSDTEVPLTVFEIAEARKTTWALIIYNKIREVKLREVNYDIGPFEE